MIRKVNYLLVQSIDQVEIQGGDWVQAESYIGLKSKGLTIGLPKYVFAIPELEFLGHQLSSSGCSPLDKNTSTISFFPLPSNKPALQRFLGMLNFYRKIIKNAALILAPLTNALKGLSKVLDLTPP